MPYIGKITVVKKDYAWIGISSVTMEDGSPHDLKTERDIYLHRQDCDIPLRPDMEVAFNADTDEKRGKDTYRAYSARETKQSRLAHLTKGGIELGVQGLGDGRFLEHSSVFASWCLSTEIAAKIKELRLDDKVVKLLVVHWPVDRRTDRTERRQLVDLADPMCAIGFNAAGVNRIVALVVVGGRMHDKYLSLDSGHYKTNVVARGDCGTVLEKGPEYLASGVIDVEVPEGLFAGKPIDWGWVNMFFKTDPRDQCAFRRRRMFAYTLQPFVALVIGIVIGFWGAVRWLGAAACILGMLSVGTRLINYVPLLHPLRDAPHDTWWEAEGSVFIPVIKKRYVPLPLAVSPLVLIFAAAATSLLEGPHFETLAWLITFSKVMLVPVVVFCLITWYVVWYDGVDWDEVKRQLHEDERRRLVAEVDELICTTTGPRRPNVWQLPFGPKTVRFYALALKQKVCKGFAAA